MATVRADGRITSHRLFAIGTFTNDSGPGGGESPTPTKSSCRRWSGCRCGRKRGDLAILGRDDQTNDEGGNEEEQTEEIEADSIVALTTRDSRRDERVPKRTRSHRKKMAATSFEGLVEY
jgi:hypothetical protein